MYTVDLASLLWMVVAFQTRIQTQSPINAGREVHAERLSWQELNRSTPGSRGDLMALLAGQNYCPNRPSDVEFVCAIKRAGNILYRKQ
jgi:hypothetical protein